MLVEASHGTASTCAYSVATTSSTDAQRLWEPAVRKKNTDIRPGNGPYFHEGLDYTETVDVRLPDFTINRHAACQLCRFCSALHLFARLCTEPRSVVLKEGATGTRRSCGACGSKHRHGPVRVPEGLRTCTQDQDRSRQIKIKFVNQAAQLKYIWNDFANVSWV